MALKPPEEKTALQRYLPIVDWLPRYNWGDIRFDVLAALRGQVRPALRTNVTQPLACVTF